MHHNICSHSGVCLWLLVYLNPTLHWECLTWAGMRVPASLVGINASMCVSKWVSVHLYVSARVRPKGGTGSRGNRDCLFLRWGQCTAMLHFRSLGLLLQTHTHMHTENGPIAPVVPPTPPTAVVHIYWQNGPSVLPQNVTHVLWSGLSKWMTTSGGDD